MTGPSRACSRPTAPELSIFHPARTSRASEASEEALATEWCRIHGRDWRYDHGIKSWFHWDGVRWAKDGTREAFDLIRQHLGATAAHVRPNIGKASVARGVEAFALADRAVAVEHDIWDRDDFLLGTPAGVVDLRTGLTNPPRREDFITRVTSVAPAEGERERWRRFIAEVTNNDSEFASYLQLILGYALTGCTREQALFFAEGAGGNGKSVFLNTATRILGDYATTAAMDTFTASKSDRHPTDLARLDGARLVAASETREGRAWDEARIKQLTGGDRIAARYMRQDFFEFTPRFKLLIIANHAPVLHNVDDAMRRRFNIIPFNHKPPNPDRDLEKKLAAEHPQILAWMIEGARQWYETGFRRPASVSTATERYFSGQDILGQWLEEECERQVGQMTLKRKAFDAWSFFARENGHAPGTQNGFTRNLERRGIFERRTSMGRFYADLNIRMTQ